MRYLSARLHGAATLFTFSALLFSAAALPASTASAAVGTEDPVIVAPADGERFGPGFTGPIRLDMAQAPVDDYSVEVSTTNQYQDEAYVWTEEFAYDGTTDELSFTLPDPINHLGRYRVAVWPTGSTNAEDRVSSSFWVVKPLRLTKDGTSALPFYPRVRDGYRDTATLRYGLNQDTTTTVRVFNPNSEQVLRQSADGREGDRRWVWNGKNGRGAKVPPGKYRVELTAQAVGGESQTVTFPVEVATGWKIRSGAAARNGYQTSGTSRSQNCYANRLYYSGETNLDCWGGRFAQAVYGFKVPKSAYNVSFRVGGHVNCCDRGVITRKGVRASGKVYRVTVRVTNWRSFTVERVKISYRWKQRI